MRNLKLSIAAIVLTLSTSAFAVHSEKYPGMNLAMSCGDIDIVNSNYTTRYHGHLSNKNLDLGTQVWLVKGHGTYSMSKTANAERKLPFFQKLGFGLFETPEYKLDLRNTVEEQGISLENRATGEKIECKVHGDCC